MNEGHFASPLIGSALWVAGAVALAAPPVGVSPEGVAAEPCPTFSWSEVEEVSGYKLVVYGVTESGEVGTDPLVSKVLPRAVHSWTPPAGSCLAAGGNYAWFVRSLGPTEGVWSEPTIFEVVDRPSVDEVEEALRTLRRYLADREEGAADPRGISSGTADGDGPARERPETRSRAAASPSSAEDAPRAADRRFEALTSDTEGLNATTAASAPTLGTPSLTVDSNIALGATSNLFKDGSVFLWGDPSSANFAFGTLALSSASGTATSNTAVGGAALKNTTGGESSYLGSRNTGVGEAALFFNSSGFVNTAIGAYALFSNTTGRGNTAVGVSTLESNDIGDRNAAIGSEALGSNTSGSANTAIGYDALSSNTSGFGNTAIGYRALISHRTGYRNIAIGDSAGVDAPYGSSRNIFIGNLGNSTDTDSNGPTIRIGDHFQERTFIAGIFETAVTGDPVHVTSSGQLGYSSSSRQFKEEIEPLDEVGDRLFELEPVTFRYRPELVAGGGELEIGLIAEEVAEVFPELVTRDEEGQPHGVRYDLLSVLFLEELQDQREELLLQDEKLQDQRRLNDMQREALRTLRRRLTAVEEGRRPPKEKRPWWRRIFTWDRDSP